MWLLLHVQKVTHSKTILCFCIFGIEVLCIWLVFMDQKCLFSDMGQYSRKFIIELCLSKSISQLGGQVVSIK